MRPISDTYIGPAGGSTVRQSTQAAGPTMPSRFRPPPTVAAYINESQAAQFIDHEDESSEQPASSNTGYLLPQTVKQNNNNNQTRVVSSGSTSNKRFAPLAKDLEKSTATTTTKTNANTIGYVAPELPKLSKLSLPHSHTETDV